MFEIRGKYNIATVFAKEIDSETYRQILEMCSFKQLEEAVIKIMPDCHAGAGCTIGTTMRMPAYTPVNPFYVGVDIGCGVDVIKISGDFSFSELDDLIRSHIPFGFAVCDQENDKAITMIDHINCKDQLENIDRLYRSLGTLGGGNHFIELSENMTQERFLLVHSGSRNLGYQVATVYGKMADKNGFLTGELLSAYLQDMAVCQHFAKLNRLAILKKITDHLGIIEMTKVCSTVHNYIEQLKENNILRKGAVSAMNDQLLVIPINMKDGTILARGKQNWDWNCSAPHGAGRILSRSQAKKKLSLLEFKKVMRGIYSTCISKATLDESPMAYKPIQDIIDQIGETVDIIDLLKPVYNFKAPEK